METETRTPGSLAIPELPESTTGRLTLPIDGDGRAWLRAVRYGDVPFVEWAEQVASLDAELERLLADEELPAGPDRARIESWSVATHQEIWNT